MNKLFYIGLLLFLASCQKERDVHFDYRITVEDYYSNQPLEQRIVIMKYCDGANFVGGSGPCDSVNFDVTDTRGVVDFSGTYERGYGHSHVFDVIGGEDYQTYLDHHFRSWEEELVVQLKPLVSTEIVITSTLAIDSITIFADVQKRKSYKFSLGDTITAYLSTIPDQYNSISVMAYKNDSLKKWDRLSFSPIYQGSNKLEHEIIN